jgi:hypothetical protein
MRRCVEWMKAQAGGGGGFMVGFSELHGRSFGE